MRGGWRRPSAHARATDRTLTPVTAMEALLDTAFTAYVLGSGVAGERGPRARQREGDEVYKKNTPLEFPQRGAGARQCAESKRSGGERWPYFWVTAATVWACHPTLRRTAQGVLAVKTTQKTAVLKNSARAGLFYTTDREPWQMLIEISCFNVYLCL